MLNWQLPSLLKFKSYHKNQIADNVNHILPQKINELTGFCIVCQRNYCKMLITQTNSTYGRDHNGAKTFMKSDLNIFESYNFTRFVSLSSYTAGWFVWCDRSFYVVKQPQEKWACDFHDDALPLSFQLQVAEVIF